MPYYFSIYNISWAVPFFYEWWKPHKLFLTSVLWYTKWCSDIQINANQSCKHVLPISKLDTLIYFQTRTTKPWQTVKVVRKFIKYFVRIDLFPHTSMLVQRYSYNPDLGGGVAKRLSSYSYGMCKNSLSLSCSLESLGCPILLERKFTWSELLSHENESAWMIFENV